MQGEMKTAQTISGAVKTFLKENGLDLNSINANLICEKIFIDKKEYTLELSKRTRSESPREPVTNTDIDFAKTIVQKMLSLMYFTNFTVNIRQEESLYILEINTKDKDGLLIGKNGQNLLAMQYLLSVILDRNLHKHVPVIIDVDSYREKRVLYLKALSKTLAEKAIGSNSEVITDFLPPYERKLIHEELAGIEPLKTFSVGRGIYKKVVITPLL